MRPAAARAGAVLDKLSSWLPPPLRQREWQRLAYEIVLEVAIVVVFLKAYNGVRNLFGSQKCTPQFALGHALQVIKVERAFGIFWEQEIQGMVIHWTSWVRFWNIFYGTAHMAVTIFVLGYLFALKPGAYQRCRTVFIIMNVLALSGYAGYPLMPPRLVNACDDPYGGCMKGYRFVDTLHEVGGLWSWKDKAVSKVSNHYAAMPSMHAGYSIWCSMSMHGYAQQAALRTLSLLYPLLTIYCIVVTANHYFLDAVFGALAFFVAVKIAPHVPRVGRGADDVADGDDGALLGGGPAAGGGGVGGGKLLLPFASGVPAGRLDGGGANGAGGGGGGGERGVDEEKQALLALQVVAASHGLGGEAGGIGGRGGGGGGGGGGGNGGSPGGAEVASSVHLSMSTLQKR